METGRAAAGRRLSAGETVLSVVAWGLIGSLIYDIWRGQRESCRELASIRSRYLEDYFRGQVADELAASGLLQLSEAVRTRAFSAESGQNAAS